MNASSSATNNSANPTVGEWLRLNTKRLENADISSARLDCLILLEQRLPSNRANILAHLDDILTDEQLQKLDKDVRLRMQHKPTQYIVGYSEFYGRQFIVSKDVLVPRPESESIITLLKTLPASKAVVDVGTGSGCLAITAKLEFPDTKVIGIDIDDACLRIAKKNVQNLVAEVKLIKGDLLSPLPATIYQLPSTILANLPYVPDESPINDAAKHEPALALYGGPDGLDLYRRLWEQIDQLDAKPAAVICESSPFGQHESLAEIARNHGYMLSKSDGMAQLYVPA